MKRGPDDEALSSPPNKARHEGNSPDFYFVSEDSDDSQEHANATLCSRCSNIDILRISTRRPRTIDPLDNIYNVAEDGIVEDIEEMNLGPAKALVVWDNCPLCHLLRGILPHQLKSSDEDVYLLSCIAIHRFEPEVYTWEALETDDGPGEVMYLYLATKSVTGPFPLADSASDAVAHQSGSIHALGMGMLARPVDPAAVNLSLVQQWVSHCMENHGDMCNHEPSLRFNDIRLIDVHDKCLVPYQQGFVYVCLSYVWGTTPRPEIDLLGKLPQLPATIEDSMSFVKSLGKRYLWVDSVSSLHSMYRNAC
jgi:Heterokaryon incompatibility protein (HET)